MEKYENSLSSDVTGNKGVYISGGNKELLMFATLVERAGVVLKLNQLNVGPSKVIRNSFVLRNKAQQLFSLK